MFCSIQAMTMAGLCHRAVAHDDAHRANVPGLEEWCAWARRTSIEAISRDDPDGHAELSPAAVAASQVPVLAWP